MTCSTTKKRSADTWGTADPRDALRRAAERTYVVDEKLTVSEWSDRFRVLAPSSAAEPGPWVTARTPYLKEVMDSCDTPGVERVSLIKASQVGGTEVLYNVLLNAVDTRPGLTLFAYPNFGLAETANRVRVHPAVHLCDRLRRKLTGSPRDLKAARLEFTDHTVDFVGGHSDANLQSRPCRMVLLDELDRFDSPDSACEAAYSRTKTFGPERLIVAVSTPTFAETGIDKQFLDGDRRRYLVPCPHCGRYQELRWSNLRWEGGSEAVPDDVKDPARGGAWMECIACDERIEDKHKPTMLARGRWVPEGQDAVRLRLGDEKYDPDGPEWQSALVGEPKRPNSTHRSYTISSFYSPFMTYGDIAAEFLRNGAEMTPKFVQEILGEPWVQAGDRIDANELALLATPKVDGGYALGEVPEQIDRLVGAIDVQKDHTWVLVAGVGLAGRLFAIVDAMRVVADPGRELVELDGLFDKPYRTASNRAVPVDAWAIDHQFRSAEVELFRQRNMNRGRMVVCVQGDGAPHAVPSKLNEVVEHRGGRARIEPLPILRVGNGFWSDWFSGNVQHSLRLARMVKTARQQGMFDSAELERDGATRILLPYDAPRALLDQLTSEHRVDGMYRGLVVQKWTLRPGRRDNHYADDVRYARALMHFLRMDRPAVVEHDAPTVVGRIEF